VHKRPTRGSYTGYGKRLPSDRPPVLTPKELALTAASDSGIGQSLGNGQAASAVGLPAGSAPPAASQGYSPLGAQSPLSGASPLSGGAPLGANPFGGDSQPGQPGASQHRGENDVPDGEGS